MSPAGALPLEIRGAHARYGTRSIFSGLSLALQPGEIFGLIGLNGVGKTTLIKSILDLGPLREGTIQIFGEDHRQPRSRRHLAYLPDKFMPVGSLRGWEFLELALAHYALPMDAVEAARVCAALGLEVNVLTRPIRTYSKGMGQKLALAATFLAERPLVILDEPMSGLDPLARVQLKQMLVAYRNHERCIFFSSHILADIEEICDRIGIFDDGRLVFVGTPRELVQRHRAATLEAAFLAAIGAPAGLRDGSPTR